MSSPLALAAATATLRNLLLTGIHAAAGLGGVEVTTQPLDRARQGVPGPQLNLFLYHASTNGAWRNRDLPTQARPGETGQPPLALDLHYLITAYGPGDSDNDGVGLRVMGCALSVLHDHPVLGREEIRNALAAAELHLQVERIRIVPELLPLDEVSKLWTAAQTHYRLSAGFQASVVLIDSRRPVKAPVPVLGRGGDDAGPSAAASLENPFPNLSAAAFPASQTGALPGDTLTLRGGNLAGTNVRVRFSSRWWDHMRERVPTSATDTEVAVEVPDDDPAGWPAGVYTAAVLVQRPGETYRRETNELPLVLSPRIVSLPAGPVARTLGTATISVGVRPEVLPQQRAALLLGDREVAAEPRADPTAILTFVVRNAPQGTHWVRVRVDGADSFLVRRDLAPPQFDPSQQVTIT